MRPFTVVVPFVLALVSRQDTEGFWKKFEPALAAYDKVEMRKVVTSDPEAAIAVCLEKGELLSLGPNPTVEAHVVALAAAWKEAMGEAFLEKEYQYLALLSSDRRKSRKQGLDQLGEAEKVGKRLKRGEDVHSEALDRYAGAARSLDEAGDAYHSAKAYMNLAELLDSSVRSSGYDNRRAAGFYRDAAERFEAIDYRGDRAKKARARYEELLAQGHDPDKGQPKPERKDPPPDSAPAKAKEGGATPAPAPKADDPSSGGGDFATGSSWVAAPLAFGVLGESESVELPSYESDDVAPTWNDVGILALVTDPVTAAAPTPGRAKMDHFKPDLFAVREKPAKYALDVDGDGTVDVPIKFGKDAIEVVRKGEEGEERHAFRFLTLGEQQSMLRVSLNLAPSADFARLKYRSVGFRTAEIAGQPIRAFDLNCDGKYGGEPLSLPVDAYAGEQEPRLDGIQVGKGARVGPASTIVEIGGKLHRLRWSAADGKPVAEARELAVPTGTLRMDFKGPATAKPVFFVVKETTDFAGSFFDLAANPKGVVVPAGTYEIAWGLLRQGKGPTTQKALLLKGKSKTITVAAGETQGIAVGRPYALEFEATRSTVAGQTQYTIAGSTLKLFGAGGERYERIWDEILRPGVTWRKAGAKAAAGKPIEMKGPTPDDVQAKATLAVLWHPLDLEIPSPGAGDWQFHLATKHRLFGEIESEWK